MTAPHLCQQPLRDRGFAPTVMVELIKRCDLEVDWVLRARMQATGDHDARVLPVLLTAATYEATAIGDPLHEWLSDLPDTFYVRAGFDTYLNWPTVTAVELERAREPVSEAIDLLVDRVVEVIYRWGTQPSGGAWSPLQRQLATMDAGL